MGEFCRRSYGRLDVKRGLVEFFSAVLDVSRVETGQYNEIYRIRCS